MTLDEIIDVQKNFADAAFRAKRTGYDAVEIHGAHHFLLSQFLTPYFNHLRDQYGGTIDNRARMLLETYAAVRKAVGEDYPIWIKLNLDDFIEDGITFDECLYVCKQLAARGVDAVEASASWYNIASQQDSNMQAVYSTFWNKAAKIAAAVDTHVFVTGGNRELKTMVNLFSTTQIDAFGMARPFMSEPDIVNRFQREFQNQ